MFSPVILAASLVVSSALGGCNTPADKRYREYLYVTNGGSDDVTVIDALTFKRIQTIRVGRNPSGVSVNTKKNEVYVVNTESNNVTFIDAERNEVLATVGVHRKPFFISVSADGSRGYVANSESNNVSVIDLGTRKVIATIPVGAAPGLAMVSPDGKTVVVPLRGEDSLAVFDTETRAEGLRLRAKVKVCKQPSDVAILPDSTKAFVACSGGSQVAIVQLKLSVPKADESHAYIHSSSTGDVTVSDEMNNDKLLAFVDVGKTPIHLAVKPDGGEIFVSNFDADTFSEIATNTNEVGGSYLTGGNPVRGVIAADNATMYISNFGSGTVAIYDISINKLLATVSVGQKPDALVLSSNQNYLFVAGSLSGDVAVVRTGLRVSSVTPSLMTMISVGKQPDAMAIKAFMATK